MSPEFLNEAKHFRSQMKWCAILCWVGTAVFTYNLFFGIERIQTALREDYSWIIVPLGAIILSIIYHNMNSNIKKYEQHSK
jgi:hypothetical protein